MKKSRLYTIIIILSFLFSSPTFAKKKALIIAIGDYPEDSNWQDLASANDAKYITQTLLSLGFVQDEISYLQNEAANKKGILDAFKKLSESLEEGDIVMIHYSGHGQQIVDDNGDEIDGLDESIVPYDSPMKFEAGVYEGENLIRDDEIGYWTDRMRNTIGPSGQLILILDSCHSGTGTRGRGRARGTHVIMGPEGSKENTIKEENFEPIKDREGLAPMFSIFGASPSELNYECLDNESNPIGSLSFAISTIASNLNKGVSYEEFFEMVKVKMAVLVPIQTPQWEGPRDQLFLKDEKAKADKLFSVTKIINRRRIKSDISHLNGVAVGAEVEIIDPMDNKVVQNGSVISITLKESIIALDEGESLTKDKLYKVKVVSQAASNLNSQMFIELKKNSKWSGLVEKLKTRNVFFESDDAADLYLTENDENKLELLTKEGKLLYGNHLDNNEMYLETKFANHIKAFNQIKFLKSYSSSSSFFDLELELIPVAVENEKITSKLNIEDFKKSDGIIQFKEGDNLTIRVTNKGKKSAYYTMVDIQPDNKVSILIPSYNHTSADYHIMPGETQEIDYYLSIAPPFGRDIIKLIASDAPLDMKSVILSEGKVTRGNNDFHPLEKLIQYSYEDGATRGDPPARVRSENISTKTLIYEIVAKE